MYQIKDPRDRSIEQMRAAESSYGKMMPDIPEPKKSAMGGVQNAAGGAMAGASLGAAMTQAGVAGSSAGPYGALFGAALGALAYYTS